MKAAAVFAGNFIAVFAPTKIRLFGINLYPKVQVEFR
jgi:hypothetical protein